MLIVKPIGPGVAGYFLDGRHEGRWTPAATRLLGLEGPVRRDGLTAVLRGEHPAGGGFLPERRAARRRAGWDLIFCAPKSLSLVQAAHPDLAAHPDRAALVLDAHVAAVGGVVGEIEARLTVARRDRAGRQVPAEGLIGAEFDHRFSAAGEPHLHSHVLVANLTRAAGRWSAVPAEEWHPGRMALAALYQLGLRYQLAERGVELDWRLRPDGLADLATVPRAAVRATSSQNRLVQTVGRFEARRQALPQPWQERATAAGLDRGGDRASRVPRLGDPALDAAVTTRLAARRSDFRRADVIVTLAACWPGGAPPGEVTAWVDRFCGRSLEVPSPTARPRWTSELARHADRELVRDLEGLEQITVLGSPPGQSHLLAQAELIDSRRAAAGLEVAVSSPAPTGVQRWAILAGAAAYRPGVRADLLVVDQADRRPSAELSRLARAARRSGAELVFVSGGTLPRLSNPASRGWSEALDGRDVQPCDRHHPWGFPTDGSEGLIGRPAAARVLEEWLDAYQSGRPVLLSALGLDEIRGLNRSARLLLGGPDGAGFQEGDRVVLLRARHDGVRHGSFGTITALAPGSVRIRWDGDRNPARHGADILGRLGFGYAASLHRASATPVPVALLGPERSAPQLRGRLLASVEERAPERARELAR